MEKYGDITIYNGDCLEVMRGLPDGSVDAIITDPPYGISFLSPRTDNHKEIANDGHGEFWWQHIPKVFDAMEADGWVGIEPLKIVRWKYI